jgi:hypothetical protein
MRLAEAMIRAGAQIEAFLIAVAYERRGREDRRNPELRAGCRESACPTHQADSALVRSLIEDLPSAPDYPAFRARKSGANKKNRWRCK